MNELVYIMWRHRNTKASSIEKWWLNTPSVIQKPTTEFQPDFQLLTQTDVVGSIFILRIETNNNLLFNHMVENMKHKTICTSWHLVYHAVVL